MSSEPAAIPLHWHALDIDEQTEFEFGDVRTFSTRTEASRFAEEDSLPAVARCTGRYSPEAIEYRNLEDRP